MHCHLSGRDSLLFLRQVKGRVWVHGAALKLNETSIPHCDLIEMQQASYLRRNPGIVALSKRFQCIPDYVTRAHYNPWHDVFLFLQSRSHRMCSKLIADIEWKRPCFLKRKITCRSPSLGTVLSIRGVSAWTSTGDDKLHRRANCPLLPAVFLFYSMLAKLSFDF